MQNHIGRLLVRDQFPSQLNVNALCLGGIGCFVLSSMRARGRTSTT